MFKLSSRRNPNELVRLPTSAISSLLKPSPDGWKSSGMNPEEHMKEMCAPVYEWAKSMK